MRGDNGTLASTPQLCNPSNNGFWCFLVVGFMSFVAIEHSHEPPYPSQNLMSKPWYRAYLLIWGVSQGTWGNLAWFQAFVGVRRTQNPVCHALGVRHAHWKNTLRAGFVCAAPSVCASPLCICTVPWKLPPILLQTHMMHTQRLCIVSLCLDLQNDFDFLVETCI